MALIVSPKQFVMSKTLVLCAALILPILFSGCRQSEDEQMIAQLRISNEIIEGLLKEKRDGFVSFIAEFPEKPETDMAKHLIYLYDSHLNDSEDSLKYEGHLDWFKNLIQEDSVWQHHAPLSAMPNSKSLTTMTSALKKNIVLTQYAMLFNQEGRIGYSSIRCDFSPFGAYHLDSTNIIMVKGMTPLMNNNYEISIDEPLANVIEVRMLGLIYLPKEKRKQYEVIITTEDPMYKSPRIDTLNVNLK